MSEPVKTGIVMVRIDEQDFELLPHTIMRWYGGSWPVQEGRFEPVDDRMAQVVYEHGFAYWFNTWVEVLLARAFLESVDATFQVLIDNGMNLFTIVTDYATSSWRSDEKLQRDE